MTARLTLLLVILASVFTPTVAASDPKALTDDLVQRINHERVGAGLLPLARALELDAAAQAHSVDMVAHNYLDHPGWDGSEPQQRAEQAGYKVPPQSGWIVVEVISAISGEPQGPLNWWLNESDQHRTVLLNPRWREIGAGYAEGGEFGHYWTALFGCRPGVLPAVVLDGRTYTPTEQCGDPQSEVALAAMAAQTAVPAPTLAPTAALPTLVPTAAPRTPVVTVGPPTLVPTVTPQLTLAVTPQLGAAGDSVNVRWSGLSTPKGTDWIGLYRSSDGDSAYLNWTYVGCATIPLDARAMGSCNLTLPRSLSQGMYEFRIFRDSDFTPLRVSPPIIVG